MLRCRSLSSCVLRGRAVQKNCVVFVGNAPSRRCSDDAQGFFQVFLFDDDDGRLIAVPEGIQFVAAIVHARPLRVMDAEVQFTHEVARGNGTVEVIDQARNEVAVHDDGRTVRYVQLFDILTDVVSRLVVVNLTLNLMGTEAEAIGHDGEDDEHRKEAAPFMPRPSGGSRPDEEGGDEQAAVTEEVSNRQKIGVHEVDDAGCRKEEAEQGVDKETVAEPRFFAAAPFQGSC